MTDYILWDQMPKCEGLPFDTRMHKFANGSTVIVTQLSNNNFAASESYDLETGTVHSYADDLTLMQLNLWLREIAERGTDASNYLDERPSR